MTHTKSCPPGKVIETSVQEFLGGWSRGHFAEHGLKCLLPEGKQVLTWATWFVQIVQAQSPPSQGMVGSVLKSKFADAHWWPALLAGLSQESDCCASVLLHSVGSEEHTDPNCTTSELSLWMCPISVEDVGGCFPSSPLRLVPLMGDSRAKVESCFVTT